LKAVILSAGRGTRIKSLEENLPKGLIPINGKPILEIIMEDLKTVGFTEFILVIGYKGELIKQYFGNGKNFGISINYVFQENQFGTADALLQTQELVKNDSFLVHLGDAINPNALKNSFSDMLDSKYEVSLLISHIKNSQNKSVGSIKVENDLIAKIAEKTKIKNADFFWAGVALFKNTKIFSKIKLLKPSHTGEFEITDALNELLNDNIEIDSFVCDKSIDAGTKDGVQEISDL